MTLSLVIPCYNEAGNIPLIFDRLRETLAARHDVEVILVNNGSTDRSAEVFEGELKCAPDVRFRLAHVPVNQGYGYGILKGLEAATGDVLAWTHADMQTDPKDVLKAYDLWLCAAEAKLVVKGARQNRRSLESFFTFGMQIVAFFALDTWMSDINAQPKLFPRSFYETYVRNDPPFDFSLDLFLLYQAKKHGYRLATVPVHFGKRLYGEAKGGGSWRTRIQLIRRTFAYIFQLRKKLRSR